MHLKPALLLASVLSISFPIAAQSTTTRATLPKESKVMEGRGWNTVPFGDTNMRYQQYMGRAHIDIPKGKKITAIGFRKEGFDIRSYPSRKLNWTIWIGETTKTRTQLTKSFAANATTPLQQVFGGIVSVPSYTSGLTNTIGTAIMINLDRTYLYGGGNLLVEIIAKDPQKKDQRVHYGVDYALGGTFKLTMFGFLGAGCVPKQNSLALFSTNMRPGGTMRQLLYRPSNGPSGFSINIIGTSTKKFGALPLPLTLSRLGPKKCLLMTDILLAIPKQVQASKVDVSVPLPRINALAGIVLNTQFLILDRSANSLGLVTSALGQRIVTANGGAQLDCAHLYWTGNGAAASQKDASSGPWLNNVPVMLIDYQ